MKTEFDHKWRLDAEGDVALTLNESTFGPLYLSFKDVRAMFLKMLARHVKETEKVIEAVEYEL